MSSVAALHKAAAKRDERCARALMVTQLSELEFLNDASAHEIVTVVGDSCPRHGHLRDCDDRKNHFRSTDNSKRLVSTHLFWKLKLGLQFPVSDDMLKKGVWKNLESCDYGIKTANGHAKVSGGPICVNPYHYIPTDYFKVMLPLIPVLHTLGLEHDRTIANSLMALGWDNTINAFDGTADARYVKGFFEQLCDRVSQLMYSPDELVSSPTSQPGDMSGSYLSQPPSTQPPTMAQAPPGIEYLRSMSETGDHFGVSDSWGFSADPIASMMQDPFCGPGLLPVMLEQFQEKHADDLDSLAHMLRSYAEQDEDSESAVSLDTTSEWSRDGSLPPPSASLYPSPHEYQSSASAAGSSGHPQGLPDLAAIAPDFLPTPSAGFPPLAVPDIDDLSMMYDPQSGYMLSGLVVPENPFAAPMDTGSAAYSAAAAAAAAAAASAASGGAYPTSALSSPGSWLAPPSPGSSSLSSSGTPGAYHSSSPLSAMSGGGLSPIPVMLSTIGSEPLLHEAHYGKSSVAPARSGSGSLAPAARAPQAHPAKAPGSASSLYPDMSAEVSAAGPAYPPPSPADSSVAGTPATPTLDGSSASASGSARASAATPTAMDEGEGEDIELVPTVPTYVQYLCRTCQVVRIDNCLPTLCPLGHPDVLMYTSNADIGYHHPKFFPEEAYTEGDVVGLFPSKDGRLGIKLVSRDNLRQAVLVGVISRSAYIEANAPAGPAGLSTAAIATTTTAATASPSSSSSSPSSTTTSTITTKSAGAARNSPRKYTDVVCMTGYVQVKVRGPVTNGDLIYACPVEGVVGLATATLPDTQDEEDLAASFLLGQCIEVNADHSECGEAEVHSVRCLVSLPFGVTARARVQSMRKLRERLFAHLQLQLQTMQEGIRRELKDGKKALRAVYDRVTRLEESKSEVDRKVAELTKLVEQLSTVDTGPGGRGNRGRGRCGGGGGGGGRRHQGGKKDRIEGVHRQGVPLRWVATQTLSEGTVVVLTSCASRQNVRFRPKTQNEASASGQFGKWARFRVHRKGDTVQLHHLGHADLWLAIDADGQIKGINSDEHVASKLIVTDLGDGIVTLKAKAAADCDYYLAFNESGRAVHKCDGKAGNMHKFAAYVETCA